MQDFEFNKQYRGVADYMKHSYRFHGILGFYEGLGVSLFRNAIMTTTELATYDEARQYVMYHTNYPDAPYLYLFYGMAAGFMASIVTHPIDELKTRVMDHPEIYKDGWTCLKLTIKHDGFLQLYTGLLPFMIRTVGYSS